MNCLPAGKCVLGKVMYASLYLVFPHVYTTGIKYNQLKTSMGSKQTAASFFPFPVQFKIELSERMVCAQRNGEISVNCKVY